MNKLIIWSDNNQWNISFVIQILCIIHLSGGVGASADGFQYVDDFDGNVIDDGGVGSSATGGSNEKHYQYYL